MTLRRVFQALRIAVNDEQATLQVAGTVSWGLGLVLHCH